MSRRALGAAIAATAMLSSGLLPLLGTAHAETCASWTDPKGDATTNAMGLPATNDDNMDIVSASLTTVGGDVVATIKSTKLLAGAYTDAGDQFVVQMTASGSIVRFVAERSETTEAAKVTNIAGSATGVARVVFDYIDSTVTISAAQAEVDKAAGKAVAGAEATNLAASTGNHVDGQALMPYDTAPAPAGTTYTVGAQCSPVVPPATLPQPAAGCATFTDGATDAAPVIAGPATAPNEPELDIKSVAIDSTPEALRAYIKVTALGAKPANFQGDRYELTFTLGTKVYTIAAGRMAMGKSVTAVPTRGQVGTTTNDALKVRGTFDIPNNTVVVSLDRASLDTVNGEPVTNGMTATAVSAKTVALQPGLQFTADTAQATDVAERTYTFGNSPCFGPPPAVLANTGKTTVQWTDAAAVAAKLTNAAGAALAGKAVKFTVGSKSVTATTGGDGVARAALNPGVAAGSYSLVTSFAGDSSADKVSLTTPFTVTAEKTKIVLSVVKSGAKRTVTAKLLDDDGHAVVGQLVTFYVNGKKVSSPKTSSKGVVTLTTAKPTQTVKAVFTTVTGKYTGSTAQTKV
jgi:hypothetical protein